MRPDRALCHRAVWVPEGHGRDRQPVAPGVGGQPQCARAAGEHGGGGRAHQDLHALVAALAPRRGRRLGHPGPLQGALSPLLQHLPSFGPLCMQPLLAAPWQSPTIGSAGHWHSHSHQDRQGLVGGVAPKMRMRQQGQAGFLEGSIPHALHLLAMRAPWPHGLRLLKERCCISAAYDSCLCSEAPALACA